MKIKRLVGGTLESNGYILYQEAGGDSFIIDPGYRAKNFLSFLEDKDLSLKGILLTHHHYDHVGGVKGIVAETGCPVYLHRLDQDRFKEKTIPLEGGETFDLSGEELLVIHTPGHTEGGVCYLSEKNRVVFTGDTIFNVDLGRTDLEDGDPVKMKETMKNIVNQWENDVTLYPGHGDPCSMKYVRWVNQEFLDMVGE